MKRMGEWRQLCPKWVISNLHRCLHELCQSHSTKWDCWACCNFNILSDLVDIQCNFYFHSLYDFYLVFLIYCDGQVELIAFIFITTCWFSSSIFSENSYQISWQDWSTCIHSIQIYVLLSFLVGQMVHQHLKHEG